MEDEKTKATLLSLLEEVAAEEGFRKPSFRIGAGSQPVSGFIGVVQRVTIEETDTGSPKPRLSLVVKCMPASKARREFYQSGNFFSNESAFYKEIIPAFTDFQKEKGITKELTPPHPRCFRTGDLLIMEDQNALGFVVTDTLETMDYAHCLLVMRELGRLHAVSFALRDQRPALFKRLTAAIRESLFTPASLPAFRSFFEPAPERALQKFEEHAKISPADKKKYMDAVKDYSVGFYDNLAKTLRPDDAEPYAVINHGDCWNDNILFKYKQGGTEPVAVCLLDFQLTRLSSPACDISLFLYCCTDRTTRRAHYHKLLQEYHSSLAKYLAKLGSDVGKMFPMEALQDQMKRFGKYGLGIAMAYLPTITCGADDLPDLDAACEAGEKEVADMFNFTHSNDSHCWERMCDVIVDVVDLGYYI